MYTRKTKGSLFSLHKIKYENIIFILALTGLSTTVNAGNIPGIPPIQPPDLQGNLQLQVSNDFFSLLDNQDDFRTQQVSLAGYINNHWLVVFDQSILTARGANQDQPDPPGSEGRLDQQSFSLAYRPYIQQTDTHIEQLMFGAGLRRYGNFNGARIQNGAHRLFKDDSIDLPYVSTQRTDVVAWLRGSRQQYFSRDSNNSTWQFGYWLDGSALVTSDGQSDGTLGAFGLLRNRDWAFWTGPRADWRSGYDRDVVQRLSAEYERGLAWAFGFAYGPVRLETVQGIGDNNNAFGSFVFTAVDDLQISPSLDVSHWDYQFAVLTPEVAVQNQFRWSPDNWRSSTGPAYSLVVDYRYGTAARNDHGSQFTISNQFIIGLESRFAGRTAQEWLQPYVMLGAGYRSEYIDGEGALAGQQSSKVSSAVLVADAGVRFHMAGNGDRWRLQLLLGMTGWLPMQKKNVVFNGRAVELLQADASWLLGLSSSFAY